MYKYNAYLNIAISTFKFKFYTYYTINNIKPHIY